MVSERRRDGCCSCAVDIRAVPVPSGYGVGSPDRLLAFRTTPNASVRSPQFSFIAVMQDQAGLDCRVYLIRLKKLVNHCVTFWIFFFGYGVLIFLLLQERAAAHALPLGFIARIFNVFPREEYGSRLQCFCVCFLVLVTGPEPDRQVDLLERKHLISFLVRSLYTKRRRTEWSCSAHGHMLAALIGQSLDKFYTLCLLDLLFIIHKFHGLVSRVDTHLLDGLRDKPFKLEPV